MSFVPCKKNDANGYVFYVSLVSQADTKLFQVNPTLAAGDFKIAVDDAAPGNLGTLPVVDADFTKRVKVVLSQAETNGDNLTVICSDAAGAEWCDLTINIQTSAQTLDEIDTNVDDIETDTAVIGALGAGLTAIPWNPAWDAEVQSECADALTAYGPPTKTEMDTGHGLLATEAKQDIIDTNVDSILVDTGTTLDGKITTVDTVVDAIKAKTDLLPSGVNKNVALSNFIFFMVLSTNHITPATGKTITATISKDGAAFVSCTNAVAEISNGFYKIDLTQAEMNYDIIALKFTEATCDQRSIIIKTST